MFAAIRIMIPAMVHSAINPDTFTLRQALTSGYITSKEIVIHISHSAPHLKIHSDCPAAHRAAFFAEHTCILLYILYSLCFNKRTVNGFGYMKIPLLSLCCFPEQSGRKAIFLFKHFGKVKYIVIAYRTGHITYGKRGIEQQRPGFFHPYTH